MKQRSSYLRKLIRKDQARMHLRSLLLAGAASEKGEASFGTAYFAKLRSRVRKPPLA